MYSSAAKLFAITGEQSYLDRFRDGANNIHEALFFFAIAVPRNFLFSGVRCSLTYVGNELSMPTSVFMRRIFVFCNIIFRFMWYLDSATIIRVTGWNAVAAFNVRLHVCSLRALPSFIFYNLLYLFTILLLSLESMAVVQ